MPQLRADPCKRRTRRATPILAGAAASPGPRHHPRPDLDQRLGHGSRISPYLLRLPLSPAPAALPGAAPIPDVLRDDDPAGIVTHRSCRPIVRTRLVLLLQQKGHPPHTERHSRNRRLSHASWSPQKSPRPDATSRSRRTGAGRHRPRRRGAPPPASAAGGPLPPSTPRAWQKSWTIHTQRPRGISSPLRNWDAETIRVVGAAWKPERRASTPGASPEGPGRCSVRRTRSARPVAHPDPLRPS